jgi:HEPN domain-containing protein
MLKCVLIYYGENINKTHDLGLLAEACQRYFEVSEEYLDMCDELTPYSVRIRYP